MFLALGGVVFLLFLAVAAATFLSSGLPGPKSRAPQRPDLSFWFRCEHRATPELEKKIEGYLERQGFRVLNLGALQRDAGVGIYDLNMTAIDANRRTLDVRAFRETPGSQSLQLYSAPPTQHDSVLEEALLTYATHELGCRTDQIARNSNGPEAAELHDWNVRRIGGLFSEAADLKKTRAQPRQGPAASN
jgi:hypothetical protein